MTKIFFIALLLALAPAAATIDCEVRAGAFLTTSHRFREVYGNATPFYELQASTPLCGTCLDFWANFDWIQKRGSSVSLHDSTRIAIGNVSLGLAYTYCLYLGEVYLGIGPSFSRVWIHNKSACVREKVSKFAYGAVVKSGYKYCFCNGLFLDLFMDYLYQPMHFKHRNDNVGGFKIGAGIGMTL